LPIGHIQKSIDQPHSLALKHRWLVWRWRRFRFFVRTVAINAVGSLFIDDYVFSAQQALKHQIAILGILRCQRF